MALPLPLRQEDNTLWAEKYRPLTVDHLVGNKGKG